MAIELQSWPQFWGFFNLKFLLFTSIDTFSFYELRFFIKQIQGLCLFKKTSLDSVSLKHISQWIVVFIKIAGNHVKVGRNVRRWLCRSFLLCMLSLIYDVTPLFTGEKHGLSAVYGVLWVRVTVIYKNFYSDIDTSREIWNFNKIPIYFSKIFK